MEFDMNHTIENENGFLGDHVPAPPDSNAELAAYLNPGGSTIRKKELLKVNSKESPAATKFNNICQTLA